MFPAHLSGLQSLTGMSSGAPKKKTRRGGRGAKSSKPGAAHHTAMNQAYATGDYAKAKTHALNFANAMHAHVASSAQPETEPDADDSPAPGMTNTPPSQPASTGNPLLAKRAAMAQALKSMRKK